MPHRLTCLWPEPTSPPATTGAGPSSSEAETTFTTTKATTSFATPYENSVSSPSQSPSAFEPATIAAQSSLWNIPKPQRFPWTFTPDHGILITGGNGSNTGVVTAVLE